MHGNPLFTGNPHNWGMGISPSELTTIADRDDVAVAEAFGDRQAGGRLWGAHPDRHRLLPRGVKTRPSRRYQRRFAGLSSPPGDRKPRVPAKSSFLFPVRESSFRIRHLGPPGGAGPRAFKCPQGVLPLPGRAQCVLGPHGVNLLSGFNQAV